MAAFVQRKGVVKGDYELDHLLKSAEGKKLVVVGEMHTDATHGKEVVTDLIKSGKFSTLYVEFSQATVNKLSSMFNSSDPYVRKMNEIINTAKANGIAVVGLEREGADEEQLARKQRGEQVRTPEDAQGWAKKIGTTMQPGKAGIVLVGDYHLEEFRGHEVTKDGDLVVELQRQGVVRSTDELVRVGTVNGATMDTQLRLFEADGLRREGIDTHADFVYSYMPQAPQSTALREKPFDKIEQMRKEAFREAMRKDTDVFKYAARP